MQIANSLLNGGRTNHAVLGAPAFQAPEAALPLDPYTLGVWLGDGTTANGNITSADDAIVARVALRSGLLPRRLAVASKSCGNATSWTVYGLAGNLRRLGILGNKGIPNQYQLASEAQRLELLAGLVDTDGHVDRDGRVEITLCHEPLARDCLQLCRGLGLKVTFRKSSAKLRGKRVGDRWRIAFSPMGADVARLERKRARLGSGVRTQRWRYITAVESVETRPVRCIFVDNAEHLYLAGEALVPTHNTTVLIMEPLAQMVMEDQRTRDPNHPYALPPGGSVGWALHLRRTLPMLEQTLVRAQRIFPQIDPGAEWMASTLTWKFSSGYRYQFGHCAERDSWDRYMSNEYSIICWDELVQFYEEQYRQICTRLRSSDPILSKMLKIRAMSNPMMKRQAGENFAVDDPQWVKRYFVDPAPRGKVVLSRMVELQSGEKVKRTRMYYPATLYDNPDKDFVRQYDIQLASAPMHIQQALRFGEWNITEGSFFGADWRPQLHVCEPFEIPPNWPMFRSMDWGHKTPGNVHWWAMDDEDNLFCVREMRFQDKTDMDVAKAIRSVEKGMGLWRDHRSTITGPADTQLWEMRGDSLKSKAQVFQEMGVPWRQADKRSRQRNAELVTKRLRDHREGTATPGIVFFSTCRHAITGVPGIQTSLTNSEEPMKGGDDHAYDSVSYACAYASHGRAGLGDRRTDDEERYEDELEERVQRGRYGYGGMV